MNKYTIAIYVNKVVVTKFEENSSYNLISDWMKGNKIAQQMLNYEADDFYIRITKRVVKEGETDG